MTKKTPKDYQKTIGVILDAQGFAEKLRLTLHSLQYDKGSTCSGFGDRFSKMNQVLDVLQELLRAELGDQITWAKDAGATEITLQLQPKHITQCDPATAEGEGDERKLSYDGVSILCVPGMPPGNATLCFADGDCVNCLWTSEILFGQISDAISDGLCEGHTPVRIEVCGETWQAISDYTRGRQGTDRRCR